MFQCLQSWVRHVNVPGDEVVRNPLLSAAFDALGNQELFETAVDLLVEVSQGGRCVGRRRRFEEAVSLAKGAGGTGLLRGWGVVCVCVWIYSSRGS